MSTSQLGAFKPSYLGVRINFPIDFSNIYNLQPEAQALYFHEYIHFIQDVTTTFGLSNSWNTYDRIRQIVSLAQRQETDLNLPLSGEEIQVQHNSFKALLEIKGDYRIGSSASSCVDCSIKKVSLVNSDILDQVVKGGKIHLLKLLLTDKAENAYEYIFGSNAVCESMAYFIERKFSENV